MSPLSNNYVDVTSGSLCNCSFKNSFQLKRHKITHTDRFECQVCKAFRGANGTHLRRHICSHINERPYQFQHCETPFRYETNLKERLILFHDPRKFPCSQCLLVLKSKYRLGAYIKVSHGEKSQKIFKCERCSFETSNRDTLKKHETTHSDLRPHKCHLCSLSFKRKGYLRNHLLTHKENRERRFVCDICGHKAIRKEHLERIS